VAISTKITYEKVDTLFLDPHNPRLGRENTGPKTTQARVLELMEDWNLEELAVSFRESGFWPQEALLVVAEQLYAKKCLVVVEGNRRLAALKLMQDAAAGNLSSKKWQELATGLKPGDPLFQEVPVLTADSRKDIEAFLGFRHVTGIMEWNPAEKAEYIARLIEQGSSYEEVRRKIGSKTETVRRNYISYRLLLQMEEAQGISVKDVEDRFSVLFLSLRTSGAQQYLQIDIAADPKQAVRPVPKDQIPLPTIGFRRSVDAHNVDLDALADWMEASVLVEQDGIVHTAELQFHLMNCFAPVFRVNQLKMSRTSCATMREALISR
jgi:transposase-like protein